MAPREDTVNNINQKDSMQILEEALVLCKFGRFQMIVLFATLNSVFSICNVSATTSYILPYAECDLNMTLMQKGLLNAISFCGQMGVCLFTGFITDNFGRRTSLIIGNFGIFICSILGGSSQSYLTMLIMKLFEGIFVGFIHGTTLVMLIESTRKDISDRMAILYGVMVSLSYLTSALLPWALLPQLWHFVIWEGYFELHSWNIYIYVSSIWSLMAAVIYYYLPESPKFLLSHGQENEALEVLKHIYSMNTGLSKNMFPIQSLNAAGKYTSTHKEGFRNQIVKGLFEVKTLFKKPLAMHVVQFSIITFITIGLLSLIRMWFPQMSTIVDNYQLKHNETQSFCIMINEYTEGLISSIENQNIVSNVIEPEICVPKISGTNTYINGIILGLVSLLFLSTYGCLVSFVGQKTLMFTPLILCAICAGCLYWSNSSIQIAILLAFSFGSLHAAASVQQGLLTRVFPTTLRTITLTFTLTAGRFGSLLGNVVFPIALETGCMIPFWTISGLALGAASVVYFLPNPQKQNVAGDKL